MLYNGGMRTHVHTYRRSHKRTIPDKAVTTKLQQIGTTEPRTNRPIPECTRASLTVAQHTVICNNKSPAELMFNRYVRTTLPSINCQQYKQPVINYKPEQRFQTQSKNLLHPIEPGTTIQISSENKHEKWKAKRQVYKKLALPHSYSVINEKET